MKCREKAEQLQHKKRSLSSGIKQVVLVLVFVVLLGLLVIESLYRENQKKYADNFAMTMKYQMSEIGGGLRNINSYLVDSLFNNDHITNLREKDDPLEVIIQSNKLLKDFQGLQQIWGNEYNFFFTLPDKELFVSTEDIRQSGEKRRKVKEFLLQSTKNTKHQNSQLWQSVKIYSDVYVYHSYHYRGGIVGCFVRQEDLFSLFEVENPEGDYEFFNAEHQPLLGKASMENFRWNSAVKEGIALQSGTLYYLDEFPVAEFTVLIRSSMFSLWQGISGLFIVLLALLLAAIATGFVILHFLKHNILHPLQYFYKHLNEYDENAPQLDGKGFAELDHAVETFNQLARQIKKLKNDIYEEKLQFQRMELEYLQLQIKPHFYISCLNIIFSLAQRKKYEKIQDLSIHLSNYMRYHFMDSTQTVQLHQELEQVREFLTIQQICHHIEVPFVNVMETEIERAEIPPLLLLTIVENSIKHNQSEKISITISAKCQKRENSDFLVLRISDDGVGFSEQQLSSLNQEQETVDTDADTTQHIGISNIRKRIKIICGEKASICFYNQNGSTVEICCPLVLHEEPKKEPEEHR